MLPLITNFKLNASVLSIGYSDKSTVILDSAYHLYELKDNEFIFAKKIFDFPPQHQFSKACALSMNGYMAIGEPKSENCHILHINNGKLVHIKTLSWHKADIYNIRFSRDGKFLITGGEDGKVFIFSLPDFNMVNILPPRPDYISNVHFGKFSPLVVYSSYDMQNCVFDVYLNKVIGEFETSSVAEDMTFFDNDRLLFFICANGESGIYNIETKKLEVKQNYESWLTRVGLTKDNNFAYIGARDGNLSYLELNKNYPSFQVKLDYEDGISSMRVINGRLYIGYSNGYLQIFDLSKYEEEFIKALEENNFKLANEVSSKNVSLKTYKLYIECRDKMWKEDFSKVSEILSKDSSQNAFKEALKVLNIYFEDESKKNEFEEFIKNLGCVEEFIKAIENKNYAFAYKLAEENSYLKQTSDFERLEEIYYETFENAKELLINSHLGDLDNGINMLKPFMQVPSKKDAISILIRNAHKFSEADKMLKNKKFSEYFKLSESFRAIKSTINYKKALFFGEQILATINELEAKGDNSKALELLDILLQFVPFQKIALNRKNDLHLKLEFLDLYNNKEYLSIFKSIQKYDSIKGIVQYIQLKEYFRNIFDRALDIASKGNTKLVYENLSQYFTIEYYRNKMESIFNISYLNEIALHLAKQNLSNSNDSTNPKNMSSQVDSKDSRQMTDNNHRETNEEIDWRQTLQSYIQMFGKSDELVKICSKYQQVTKILDSIELAKKDVEYLPSILIIKQ